MAKRVAKKSISIKSINKRDNSKRNWVILASVFAVCVVAVLAARHYSYDQSAKMSPPFNLQYLQVQAIDSSTSAPIAGANVYVWDGLASGHLVASGSTDASGNFQVGVNPPLLVGQTYYLDVIMGGRVNGGSYGYVENKAVVVSTSSPNYVSGAGGSGYVKITIPLKIRSDAASFSYALSWKNTKSTCQAPVAKNILLKGVLHENIGGAIIDESLGSLGHTDDAGKIQFYIAPTDLQGIELEVDLDGGYTLVDGTTALYKGSVSPNQIVGKDFQLGGTNPNPIGPECVKKSI